MIVGHRPAGVVAGLAARLRRSLGVAPAVTGETILIAGYYAFGVVVVIFAVFAALNIGLRSVNNAWTFFQLP